MRLRTFLIALLALAAVPAVALDPGFPTNLPSQTFGKITLPPVDRGSGGDASGLCTRLSPTQPCLPLNFPQGAIPARWFGVLGDGTNETAKINLAITLATGLGRPLYFPAGSTYRVQQMTVPVSGAHLIIDGTIKLIDGGQGYTLTVSSEPATTTVNDVVLEGTGTIDGNRDLAGANATACINAYRVVNFTVRGLTARNCKLFPINVWKGSKKIHLSYLTLQDSGNSAQCAAIVEDCQADNLTVFGINDYGFAFYGGVKGGSLTNSYLHHNTAGGAVVLSDPAGGSETALPSTGITIAGNRMAYNYGAGVQVQADHGADVQHSNITIANNKLHHNHQGPALPAPYGGVYAKDVSNLTITGNQIHDDGLAGSGFGSIGVWLQTNLSTALVSGNTILREGQGGTTGVGVQVNPAAQSVSVVNNIIRDDQASKTMAFALNGSFGDNTNGRVTGNAYAGMIGANDNMAYGNDTVRDGAWQSYTPTLVMGNGSAIGANAAGQYTYDGRTLSMSASVVVTNLGTASGNLRVGTPLGLTAAQMQCDGAVRENAIAGKVLQALITPGNAYVSVTTPDGSSAVAANSNITLSLTCRIR
jgi:hypothetical protein